MATEQSVMAVIRASRPTFRSPHDKVAYAIHASLLAAGYVLIATGPPAFTDDALSSASTDEVGTDGWNEFEDNYAFLYSNPEKGSKKVLVKCLAMNDKLLVDALRDGDSEPLHLESDVGEYVANNGGSNYSSQYKNLGELVSVVDKEILSKLSGPKTTKSTTMPGSSEIRGSRADTKQPKVGVMEPQDPQPYNPSGVVVPPIYPTIGGSDLFPGSGAGMYPPRGDFGSGGGMFVGPDHPLFGGRIGEQPGFPGGQPGVPPGARFDPYGPPGFPGFEPNRFTRNPRRPGGGTHPDLEYFRDNDFI